MAPLQKLEIEDGNPARSPGFSDLQRRRHPYVKYGLLAWTAVFFIGLPFGFGRSASRFPVDEPSLHTWTELKLEPFDLLLDVKNKRDVIHQHAGWFGGLVDKFMSDEAFMNKVMAEIVDQLPGLLAAKGFQAEVKGSSVQGLKAAITLRVFGYDASYLCTQAWLSKCGEVFARLLQVPSSLSTLMNDTSYASTFEEHVKDTMREGLLFRLPEKAAKQLKAEGLDAAVTTNPPAAEWIEPELETQKDVILHVEIRSRHKVVEAAKAYAGSWLGLTEKAVHSLSQVTFMTKVRNAVEQEVTHNLEQELGSTMSFTVKVLDEADAGSPDEQRTFWVHVQVTPVDLIGTFRRQMPAGFSGNASLMMDSMEQLVTLGLSDLSSSKTTFYNRLFDGFADVLQRKLEEALRVQIGADIWNASMDGFKHFQEYAASGRCCASKQEDVQTLFLVPKDMLRHSAVNKLGVADASFSCHVLGCSESLRCPPVVVSQNRRACVHIGGTEGAMPAEETAYRPPEECLELRQEKVKTRIQVNRVTDACQQVK